MNNSLSRESVIFPKIRVRTVGEGIDSQTVLRRGHIHVVLTVIKIGILERQIFDNKVNLEQKWRC